MFILFAYFVYSLLFALLYLSTKHKYLLLPLTELSTVVGSMPRPDMSHDFFGFLTERCECTLRFAWESLFCQVHAFEVCMYTYFNLLPINHLNVFVCRNFIPSKILSSNIISCNIIYSAIRILKSWGFYLSRPSAGNKQNVHIVSFSCQACTHSRPSARHTIICFIARSRKTEFRR